MSMMSEFIIWSSGKLISMVHLSFLNNSIRQENLALKLLLFEDDVVSVILMQDSFQITSVI